MKQTIYSLTIALAFALSPAAYAQDAASTEAPKAEETAPETTKAAEEFPVAGEVAEPKPGQLYLREQQGTWEVRCAKAAEEGQKEACHLYQQLDDEDGNKLAIVEIQRLPEGKKAAAGVIFTSPLGSVLTVGVKLRIDTGKVQPYPYLFCDEIGCTSRFGLTGGQVASMRKGANATVTIAAISSPDDPIKLKMSLTGFTAAWNALAK